MRTGSTSGSKFGSPSVNEFVSAYRNGILNRNEVAAKVLPLVQGMARRHVKANRLRVDADDLAQEVMIRFDQKILDELDLVRPAEALLLEYIRLVAMELWRGLSEEVNESSLPGKEDGDNLLEELAERQESGGFGDGGMAKVVGKKLALDKINALIARRTPCIPLVKDTSAKREHLVGDESMSKAPATDQGCPHEDEAGQESRSNQVHESHVEFRNILQRSGKTHQEFASALGISPSRLSSYIYIRTKKVPGKIMEKARELESNINQDEQRLASWYSAAELEDILRDWADRLSLSLLDQAEMADRLGVSQASYSRWLNKLARPSFSRYKECENRVRGIEEERRRSAA